MFDVLFVSNAFPTLICEAQEREPWEIQKYLKTSKQLLENKQNKQSVSTFVPMWVYALPTFALPPSRLFLVFVDLEDLLSFTIWMGRCAALFPISLSLVAAAQLRSVQECRPHGTPNRINSGSKAGERHEESEASKRMSVATSINRSSKV